MQQSLAALRYRLQEGFVDLQPLQILATRVTSWGQWRVTFHILGTSHALCLEHRDVFLTEILACADFPESRPLLEQENDRTVQKLTYTGHGLYGETVFTPFTLAEGDALKEPPWTETLELAYPALPGQATPRTRMGWHITPECLRVETVHTYPEEEQGIRSMTHFWERPHAG